MLKCAASASVATLHCPSHPVYESSSSTLKEIYEKSHSRDVVDGRQNTSIGGGVAWYSGDRRLSCVIRRRAVAQWHCKARAGRVDEF